METFITGQGFYLRGKVRDLLPFLQQFDSQQSVLELIHLQLN